LLAVKAERRGSLVVDVAPNPDHNLEGLPELDGRVHVIELSGDDFAIAACSTRWPSRRRRCERTWPARA
jgi:hypothetical protein